jgi:hypothetical protein
VRVAGVVAERLGAFGLNEFLAQIREAASSTQPLGFTGINAEMGFTRIRSEEWVQPPQLDARVGEKI